MTVLKVRGVGVSSQSIEGELIVLNELRSTYLRLVGAGATLWPLLREGTSEDELTAALVEEYGIDENRARTDVEVFVAALVENDLLEPAP